jgi:hypothetical protein
MDADAERVVRKIKCRIDGSVDVGEGWVKPPQHVVRTLNVSLARKNAAVSLYALRRLPTCRLRPTGCRPLRRVVRVRPRERRAESSRRASRAGPARPRPPHDPEVARRRP